MDREAWRATVHRVTKSRTQMSHFHFLIQVKGMSSQGLPSDIQSRIHVPACYNLHFVLLRTSFEAS